MSGLFRFSGWPARERVYGLEAKRAWDAVSKVALASTARIDHRDLIPQPLPEAFEGTDMPVLVMPVLESLQRPPDAIRVPM